MTHALPGTSLAFRFTLCFVLALTVAACSGDEEDVNSEEKARLAYLGLHASVDKAINLGMKGFNEASNANIPAQMTTGDVSGTMTVTGNVDQGVSANKTMHLFIALDDYEDDVPDSELSVAYTTDPAALPIFDIKLNNIPDGTFSGGITGAVTMAGDLIGTVTLTLTFAGDIMADAADPTKIVRVPGTTTVTGTAVSDYGTFNVDLTL